MTLKQAVLLIWLVWNLLVALVYAWDKFCAMRGQWRVSEKTLLIMTLLVGGLGAFVAAKVCHHKTKKWYFHLTWWLGMLMTLGLFYLLFVYLPAN